MDKKRLKSIYATRAIGKAFDIIELLDDYPEGALVSEMGAQE